VAGARTHTFQVVLLLFFSLALGFGLGVVAGRLIVQKKKKDFLRKAGPVMMKRMQAISQANKKGNSSYDFEYNGPYPVLGQNN